MLTSVNIVLGRSVPFYTSAWACVTAEWVRSRNPNKKIMIQNKRNEYKCVNCHRKVTFTLYIISYHIIIECMLVGKLSSSWPWNVKEYYVNRSPLSIGILRHTMQILFTEMHLILRKLSNLLSFRAILALIASQSPFGK